MKSARAKVLDNILLSVFFGKMGSDQKEVRTEGTMKNHKVTALPWSFKKTIRTTQYHFSSSISYTTNFG